METAEWLVRENHANPEDFQVYCGYAGWRPSQLQNELERSCWYMASVDSQTILQELLNRRKGDSDPMGLETWNKLVRRIGRLDTSTNHTNSERFDDGMLKEWVHANLVDPVKSTATAKPPTVPPGTIMRASGSFLLDNQEFHKCLFLVLEDKPAATVGVLLNLPGASSIEIGNESIPLRYGGKFGVKGQVEKPITWYHCHEGLREARVGTPLGSTGVWSCSQEDAETAIEMNMASPGDFLVVQGACVFQKPSEAWDQFDRVPRSKVSQAWDTLLSQNCMSRDTLNLNLDIARSAWALSGREDSVGSDSCEGPNKIISTDLTDMAWRSWVVTFLLCDPSLRGV